MIYPGFLLACLLAAISLSGHTDEKLTNHYSAITVNGHALDYNAIPMNSQGVLAFVEGVPQSKKHRPMLFRVTLRRAGTAIQQWPSRTGEGVYSVQLEELWPVARLGDELLIESVGTSTKQEAYSQGTLVIKLIAVNWLFVNKC